MGYPEVLANILVDVGNDDFRVTNGVPLRLVDPGVQAGHVDVLDLLTRGNFVV